MATDQGPQPTTEQPSNWLERLAQRRRETAYALTAVGGLLAIAALVGIVRDWSAGVPVPYFLGVFLGLFVLGAGVWQLVRTPGGRLSEADITRLLVLVLGGVAGLVAVLVSITLVYQWWDSVFAGGFESWRKSWGRVWVCLLALFGGLAVMFFSLQLARAEERSNATLRRLLYGYNAVLTGLLLAAVLAIINILSYINLKPFSVLHSQFDWTESNIYTLSPDSRKLLDSLKKPVKVYVLLTGGDGLRSEVENLMNNAKAVTTKFDVEYISPDQEWKKVTKLQNDFQVLEREREGLLIVSGGTDQRPEHEFITRNQLFESKPPRPGEKPRFQLKAENELMKKISFLEEGKTQAVLYFTQGNGEPDLNASDAAGPNPGLGLLKGRLTERGNYDVKPLTFEPSVEKVPDDATAVVVVRPTVPFSAGAVQALRGYMNRAGGDPKKKGKLLVMLDVVVTPEGTMLQTGLEPLLEEFNVQPKNNRVLSLAREVRPGMVLAWPNVSSHNPIAEAFSPEEGVVQRFPFDDVREVQARTANPNPQYTAEVIFQVPPREFVFTEANLKADPATLINTLRKGDRRDVVARISSDPLPVAVAVSESKAPEPSDDPHAFMRQSERLPRLVVFGDATWATNRLMAGSLGKESYDLMAYTLAWLRERPTAGNFADPKDRAAYTLSSRPELFWRLVLQPMSLILVGIVTLGGGIWLVRRR